MATSSLRRISCYCSNNISKGKHLCQHVRLAAVATAQKHAASSSSSTLSSSSGAQYKMPHGSAANRNATQFVKVLRRSGGAAKVQLGSGHSRIGMGRSDNGHHNNNHFSRRNSQATTLSGSSAATVCHERPASSIADCRRGGEDFSLRRSHYERLQQEVSKIQSASAFAASRRACKCAAAAMATAAVGKQAPLQSWQRANAAVDARLLALQRFRLEHLDHCFTAARQIDLKMQAYCGPAPWPTESGDVVMPMVACTPVLTPVTVRAALQRLRGLPAAPERPAADASAQQRNEARRQEQLRRAALDKSLALRFQPTC